MEDAGEDTLYGAVGADVLNGGTEEDFLFGGPGNGDRLEGGPGGDGYNCGEGIGDIVIGFNPAEGDYYMDEEGTDLATVDAAAETRCWMRSINSDLLLGGIAT